MCSSPLGVCAMNSDVLACIFRHCVPPEGGTFLLKEAPWTLGQVCRYWRQVALNTPLLWCSVSFKDGYFLRSSARACDVLSEALRRAATTKLHLTVEWDDPLKFTDRQPLYDMIRGRSEDWVSLNLVLYHGAVPPIVTSATQLSSLQKFQCHVKRRRNDTSGMVKQLIERVSRAPLLSSASFRGHFLTEDYVPSNDLRGVTSWTSLQTLDLHLFVEHALNAMLLDCSPQLEKLVLSSTGRRKAIQITGDVVHLPRLKTLELHHIPDWCSKLSLPCLRHLTVVGLEMEMNATPLFDMLQQSGILLQTISFIDNAFLDLTIVRLLRLTPAVTTLTVTGTLFPHIFDSLATDGSLLPCLNTLIASCTETMGIIADYSPSLASVLRAVESRIDTLDVLKVQVIPRRLEEEAYWRLRNLSRQNLSVEISERRCIDELWAEIPELVMLVIGVATFAGIFHSDTVISHPEQVYPLLEYLCDVVLSEEAQSYTLTMIEKYFREENSEFLSRQSLISKDDLPTDPVVRQMATHLIDKLEEQSGVKIWA